MMKRYRESAGFSQQGLADAAGVHKRNIQEWEKKGVEHAIVENVLKVTAVLDCTIDDLLRK